MGEERGGVMEMVEVWQPSRQNLDQRPALLRVERGEKDAESTNTTSSRELRLLTSSHSLPICSVLMSLLTSTSCSSLRFATARVGSRGVRWLQCQCFLLEQSPSTDAG